MRVRSHTSAAAVAATLFAFTALAADPKVEVQTEVVLAQEKGNSLEPAELSKMQAALKPKKAYGTLKRLSTSRLTLTSKPVPVTMPTGSNGELSLIHVKDNIATVRLKVGALDSTLNLGGEGSLYQHAGTYQGGDLWVVLSRPKVVFATVDRAQLHGRWMIDPDDVAGFEQLGLHGFDFDKHGDVVLSALGDGGMGRALFCWRLDDTELVLEEVASKTLRRHLVYFEEPDVLRLDGARYLRREEKPIDSESGLFCIGSAGIRHALASIAFEAPEGVQSFEPLLLLDGEDALVAERVDSRQRAQERARASSALRCAYVHDGSSEGVRAVVAVASERCRAQGRTLLLRYGFKNGAVECLPPLDSAPSENFW